VVVLAVVAQAVALVNQAIAVVQVVELVSAVPQRQQAERVQLVKVTAEPMSKAVDPVAVVVEQTQHLPLQPVAWENPARFIPYLAIFQMAAPVTDQAATALFHQHRQQTARGVAVAVGVQLEQLEHQALLWFSM
jgi:hypothetical protein